MVNIQVTHGAYTFGPGQDPTEALVEAGQKMYMNKRITKDGDPR
jgi:hypothetical protein